MQHRPQYFSKIIKLIKLPKNNLGGKIVKLLISHFLTIFFPSLINHETDGPVTPRYLATSDTGKPSILQLMKVNFFLHSEHLLKRLTSFIPLAFTPEIFANFESTLSSGQASRNTIKNPFQNDTVMLLPQQQEIYDTINVHSQQGGLCLIMGEPGTGKTVIKEAIRQKSDKRMLIVTISRTMHTYTNTIRILCAAFNINDEGAHFKCEKRLIEAAYALKRDGKILVTVIDEAHLMEMETMRKLRLMFDEFPKNHNLILIGQLELLTNMSLTIYQDIKSRVTFSTTLKKLNPDDMKTFILDQISKAGMGHNTFTPEALSLITRSADGIIRRARNLCLSCMLEAVRDRKKTIDIDNVNRVLIQPHWRNDNDIQQ